MFTKIILETEQKELLIIMVQAHRNIPKDKRQGFLFAETMGGGIIVHEGLPAGQAAAYIGDLEELASNGLVNRRYVGTHQYFDITSLGFRYYENLFLSADQPVRRLEEKIMNYLNAENFKKKYPSASQKWTRASDKLWSPDSEKQLTVIGHLCREAMQDFINVLVDQFKPPEVDKDKAHTASRLMAVLELESRGVGKSIPPFLVALSVYWGTICDLAQRQEHAGKKEGQPLVWEDARRLVFQTAVAMFEIDATLS